MARTDWPVERPKTRDNEAVPLSPLSNIEGGYTPVPNALLRVWVPALSGAEAAILLWLIQDTLSWHRTESNPTTYRLISKRVNLHRHSVERAVAVLTEIGLMQVCELGERTSAYTQTFAINTLLLQDPPMNLEALVQELDRLRQAISSKKPTDRDHKRDIGGPKTGPILVPKVDRSEEEETKGPNKKTVSASFGSQELELEIRQRIARSRLAVLGGCCLDNRTVRNIASQFQRLDDNGHLREALEKLEAKCAEFARHPGKAESWGLIVKVSRDAITELLARTELSEGLPSGSERQRPWAWLTAEERAAVLAASERSA